MSRCISGLVLIPAEEPAILTYAALVGLALPAAERRMVGSVIKLSNGVELPTVGLGTFKATGESVQVAVKAAVQCGITHIDTAAIYKVTITRACCSSR